MCFSALAGTMPQGKNVSVEWAKHARAKGSGHHKPQSIIAAARKKISPAGPRADSMTRTRMARRQGRGFPQ
ncbi:MAG TPA: hypothetical protein VJS37_13985, partial [Terriglobales bacterium]|nr:hypothetical protein [Terriglobales bacterium]